MKKQKLHFNELLIRYNRYVQKLKRLQSVGRNLHRQGVLRRHIERLYFKLCALQVSFKKNIAIVGLTTAAMVSFQDTKAQTTFDTPQTNPFGLVDVGYSVSHASFADLDDDGDFDMMAGQFYANFFYFENIGTADSPDYAPIVENPFGLAPDYVFDLRTRSQFVDLDDDGDFDIMHTNGPGDYIYYENIGTASAPDFSAPVVFPFGFFDVGVSPDITFSDLDDDGDFDALVGTLNNDFFYFENIGSADAPAFEVPVNDPFGLPEDLFDVNLATPIDLDGDGDKDILYTTIAENTTNTIEYRYVENTGTINIPDFSSAPQINPFGIVPVPTQGLTPEFVDLDNDGDMDIVSGGYLGNFTYYENITPPPLGINDLESAEAAIIVSPNPATDILHISNRQQFLLHIGKIYDITGRLIMQVDFEDTDIEKTINIGPLQSGTYTILVSTEFGQFTKKLIKQ